MSGINVDFTIKNQKGTPAFYSDIFANRPTYGYPGRVFISTDTGAIYEDTGTSWTLIADAGAGTTGTLEQVTTNGNTTTQGIVISAGNLAIGTATAGAPLDVHTTTGTAAQFNGTTTNNAFVFFQNAGTSKWRVGNLYNAGANSFQIYDVLNSTARLTILNSGAATFSGKINANAALSNTAGAFALAMSGDYAGLRTGTDGSFNVDVYKTGTGYINPFTISTTGVATFSSSVTASAFIPSGATVPTNGMYLSAANTLNFATNTTERMRITSGGNVLIGTTTDSGQGVLQVSGGITGGGISLTGEILSASATLNKGYYHVFTGGAGQTLTLPSPSSNNYQYVIINTTANTLTIAAATSTTITDLTSSNVASITLIANARTLIIADGGTKYYQVF